MVSVPPSKSVIDAWEKLGNLNWNWGSLKPYFHKSHSAEKLAVDVQEHLSVSEPTDMIGPLQNSYTSHLEDPIPKAWNETFNNIGLQMTSDPFSGLGVGSFSSLCSVDPKSGERSYSGTAYFEPVAHRENLHVLTGSLVEKILLEKKQSGINATGVQFQHNGTTMIALSKMEVILAAGGLQSPKILELSGIGKAELLSQYGIEIFIDNPYVGENLQDHIIDRIGLVGFGSDGLSMPNQEPIDAAIAKYGTKRSAPGVKTSLVGVPSYAYLPVIEFLAPGGDAILQSLLCANIPEDNDLTHPTHPLAREYYDIARSMLEKEGEASGSYIYVNLQTNTEDSAPSKVSTLGVMLSNPLSRGSVHITSSNPIIPPTIDPQYFTHPLDLEIYARHIQYLKIISLSEPFRSTILSQGGHVAEPKCYFQDLEVAKEYVRRTATSMWHPTSTCSMLPREKGGVVDDRLRVYGTRNVRVVDASMMPLVPRANTQATIYAVAEKAADIIKADHGLNEL
jgi:choline dehydrogenase-like flavoprotein